MSRNSWVWVIVVLTVAVMLVSAPYLVKRAGMSRGRVAQNDLTGKNAPEFALESLQGATVHLSDYRGKAVLLNFWATWCPPCKIEMPWFEDLQKQYGPQGLQVVGIAMDDASKDDISKFAKAVGVNYTILLGKDSVGDAYGGIPYLPSTFLIDRDGKVVNRILGLKSRSEIEDDVKAALSEGHLAQK